MTKSRIIKRTYPDNRIEYVIQRKNIWTLFDWVDAAYSCVSMDNCRDSFSTLEEAKGNLCLVDGTKTKEDILT